MKWNLFLTVTLATAACLNAAAPINDLFEDASVLTGQEAHETGTNIGASPYNQPGEPAHNFGYGVWWRWEAPANGVVTLDTLGSNFDTLLAVFTGSSLDQLSLLAGNDNAVGSTSSELKLPTAKGEVYSILIGSRMLSFDTGTYHLNLRFEATGGATPVTGSDLFHQRPQLVGTDCLGIAANFFMTESVGEPRLGIGRTIWWNWTAPSTGEVTIDTEGSDFYTVLGVFAGTELETLNLVAANFQVPEKKHSKVTFQTERGRSYPIRVGIGSTFDQIGHVRLNVRHVENANPAGIPGSAGFDRRGVLEGANALGLANNRLGTPVWWTWTAPFDGPVTLNTQGSDFNTHVSVYSGSLLGDLRPLRNADFLANQNSVPLTFAAKHGDVFQISVTTAGGVNPTPGNVLLNLQQQGGADSSLRIRPAVQVEFFTQLNSRYQVQRSINLHDWINAGEPFQGTGDWHSWFFPAPPETREFYRALILP